VGSRGAEYAGLRALCASCCCVRLPCGGMPRFTQISNAEVAIDSAPLPSLTPRQHQHYRQHRHYQHYQHHQHHATDFTTAPSSDVHEVEYPFEWSRVDTQCGT
jgi:hypothetical protein